MGDFFREDMRKQGITPLLTESDSITGSSRALVSPDGERTMATFLGAAVELWADLLSVNIFSGYDHLHIEGYLVLNHDLVEKALFYAGNNGMTVSLDLASYNVVEANLDFLKRIIPGPFRLSLPMKTKPGPLQASLIRIRRWKLLPPDVIRPL